MQHRNLFKFQFYTRKQALYYCSEHIYDRRNSRIKIFRAPISNLSRSISISSTPLICNIIYFFRYEIYGRRLIDVPVTGGLVTNKMGEFIGRCGDMSEMWFYNVRKCNRIWRFCELLCVFSKGKVLIIRIYCRVSIYGFVSTRFFWMEDVRAFCL